MADTKSIMEQLGGQGEAKARSLVSTRDSAGSSIQENTELVEECDVPVPDYTDALLASAKPQQKKRDTIR